MLRLVGKYDPEKDAIAVRLEQSEIRRVCGEEKCRKKAEIKSATGMDIEIHGCIEIEIELNETPLNGPAR